MRKTRQQMTNASHAFKWATGRQYCVAVGNPTSDHTNTCSGCPSSDRPCTRAREKIATAAYSLLPTASASAALRLQKVFCLLAAFIFFPVSFKGNKKKKSIYKNSFLLTMLSPFFRFAAEEGCVQGKECQLLRKAFISKITKKKKRKRKKKSPKQQIRN